MKKRIIINKFVTIPTLILIGLLTSCSEDKYDATDSKPAEKVVEKTKEMAEDAKESMVNAAEAIKDFTIDKKDDAVKNRRPAGESGQHLAFADNVSQQGAVKSHSGHQ